MRTKLLKVLVRGCTFAHSFEVAKVPPEHHSVPVRLKMEDGSYDWIWVRKDIVAPVAKSRKRKNGLAE